MTAKPATAAAEHRTSGDGPREMVAFCQWLLSEETAEASGGAGVSADARGHAAGRADLDEAITVRWHRLLLNAADDQFSRLLRVVHREAALLVERTAQPWEDGLPAGQPDPLSRAVGRAAARLSALAAGAAPGSREAALLRELQGPLLRELVAGFHEASRPAGETERRLTSRVAELAALQKINSVVNSSLDLSEVLAMTVDVVAEVMHADVTAIFLLEENGRLVLRATRGLNPAAVGQISLALGEGITGWTAQYGKPVAVADSWRDRRFAYVPALMEEPYHGWLSVPIILFRANNAPNKLIGVLNIETRAAKEFAPEEVAFAETVAGQIAIAIENARLYGLTDEKLREKVHQLQVLQRVTASLVSSLDIREVLTSMARQAAMITGTDMAGIFELDEERQRLRIVAHHKLSEQYLSVEVRVGEGAVGLAVAERKPIVVLDAQADPRLAQSSAARWVAEEGYRSMFSVPLISRNRVLGGISVYTRERHEFSGDQINLLFTFANDAAIAIENARLYDEMRRGLEMKSTLLQEMHHRVKNNLQMMASLLRLQMRRTKSKEAEKTLAVTHAQIESLGAAHDLLSQESIGLTTVNEIARRVADIAVADLLPRDKRIVVETGGEPVAVASQSATLLALVLNELICNAILHGLDGRDEGRVIVTACEVAAGLAGTDHAGGAAATMGATGTPGAAGTAAPTQPAPAAPAAPAAGTNGTDGWVEIEVADDGDGLPGSFSLDHNAGLGLSIVQRLVVEQLKGAFELGSRPEGGTRARVLLPR
ncbi:MAG: GAF domain-containing protein [Chloroflexi bacterium]|nr:GAF domain-containing protein [Chloroflexota bacterium]